MTPDFEVLPRGALGRFLPGAHLTERLESLYEPEPMSGCWLWIGAKDRHGYGHIWADGKMELAHRVAYRIYVGPITAPTLDHLCRNRGCINPGHTEPVTHAVNILRGATLPAANAKKTICYRGHPFDEENTYWAPDGTRRCHACSRAYHRARGWK